MKTIPFQHNDKDFSVTYFRTREGPNWFLCYYKNVSRGLIEPLDAWRTLGIARFTDSGKALKLWCLDMHDQYGASEHSDDDEVVKEEFFDVPLGSTDVPVNKMVT